MKEEIMNTPYTRERYSHGGRTPDHHDQMQNGSLDGSSPEQLDRIQRETERLLQNIGQGSTENTPTDLPLH
jgi:hypothetical protein